MSVGTLARVFYHHSSKIGAFNSSYLLSKRGVIHSETVIDRLNYSKKAEGAYSSSPERLSQLKRAEKTVAVIAGVSLVAGYFALKRTFTSAGKMNGDQDKKAVPATPRPLVVAGPSGSGKSTILKAAFQEYPNAFGFSVSHTTRQPRSGEVDGREYHFTSKDAMLKSIAKGDFIEHAEFSGNVYGTSKRAVRDVRKQGKICVLDIDMQGVRSIKKTDLGPAYILIKPPSMDILEERLRGRGTENEESIKKRLETAKVELEYALVPGVFDYIVTNGDKEQAIKEFFRILNELYGDLLKPK